MADLPRDDPYRVLGVAPTATSAEITAAFHRLVRKLHPDTQHNSDPEELARVLAAYQRLRGLRQPTNETTDHDQPNHEPQRRTSATRDRNPGTTSIPVRQNPPSRTTDLRVGPVRRHQQ